MTDQPVSSEVKTTSPEVNSAAATKKNPPILFILLGIALLIIVGVGSYYGYQIVNKPVIIKEKMQTIQPVAEDYNKSVEKIIEHLEEDGEFDSDYFEREAEKGKAMVKTAEDQLKTLETMTDKITTPELAAYKDHLKNYIKTSKQLIALEKDNVTITEGYIKPTRDYEELTDDVSNASNYIYSDPDQYIETLKDAVDSENKVIEDLSKIKVEDEMKELNELLIKLYKIEVDFFNALIDGVETRSSKKISDAEKTYTDKRREITKDISRLSDKLEEKVENLSDEVESSKKKIDEEYSRLRVEYKF